MIGALAEYEYGQGRRMDALGHVRGIFLSLCVRGGGRECGGEGTYKCAVVDWAQFVCLPNRGMFTQRGKSTFR